MDPYFTKGSLVTYKGKVYEVFQSEKRSDMLVLRKPGSQNAEIYTWKRKCRKVAG